MYLLIVITTWQSMTDLRLGEVFTKVISQIIGHVMYKNDPISYTLMATFILNRINYMQRKIRD